MDSRMSSAPSVVLPPPRRGLVLALVIAITAAFLALTWAIDSAYQKQRALLGREWLKTGDADFAAGKAAAAVEAYRAALQYDPDNSEITLKLAESLARAGEERQASSYLLALLQEEPGNGPVNLALARLAARQQDTTSALRYYHGAIYGGWFGHGEVMRRQARLELIDFLLGRKDLTDARSELIGVTGDLPRDPAVVASVAERFVRAGDDANALRLYRDAISLKPSTPGVISGAGLAAFRLGNYRAAVEYLQRAKAAGADAAVATTLETARAVLEIDPFARGLSNLRRIERLRRLLEIADARVQGCKPSATASAIAPQAAGVVQQLDLAERIAVARREMDHAREVDPDIVDKMMNLLLESEQARPDCAPPSPQDAAIVLIAHRREAVEQ
jgi:tetratricopeptide (TPR) repeat protein